MDALHEVYSKEEALSKNVLLAFEEQYPDVLKKDNLTDILSHLRKKLDNE